MLEDIKQFGFPYTIVSGLISYVAVSYISITLNFGLGNIILIISPFLFGWFYFLLGSYVRMTFHEESVKQKQIRQIMILAALIVFPFIIDLLFLQYRPLPSRMINFLYVTSFITCSYCVILFFAIKRQWSNKFRSLPYLLIIAGIGFSFYLPKFIESAPFKWMLFLAGLLFLAIAMIWRVREILRGDELERQIHLEALAFVFPLSLLITGFIYLIHFHFSISISENIVGFLPLVFGLLYQFISKLRRIRYS
ncbi:MAG: hypothetical protein WC061_10515 [Melioribacteraceae bacterium]